MAVMLLTGVQGMAQETVATLRTVPQVSKLPVRSVHRIMQDSEGYMWYATVDGICRDDGYNIRTFRNDYLHPTAMKSNLVICMAEDSLHRILFGTSIGAFYIDKRDYLIRPFCAGQLANATINELRVAADGTVFLSTNRQTYVIPRGQTDTAELTQAQDGASTFHQLPDGTMLAGCYSQGLCRFLPQSRRWTPLDSVSRNLHVIHMAESHGFLWLATTDRGIFRCDLKVFDPARRYVPQPPAYNLAGQPVNHYFFLQPHPDSGLLWATSFDDLHAFRLTAAGRLEAIDLHQALTNFQPQLKMINELVCDRDRNIWVAGYDRPSFIIDFEQTGIQRFHVPALQSRFNRATNIVTLCRDAEPSLYWISQERLGLCTYRPASDHLVVWSDCPALRHTHLDIVHELIPSREPHHIWALTGSPYVYNVSVRPADGQMEMHHEVKVPGLWPKTIFEDRQGRLWIGTYGGIFRYEPATRRLTAVADTIGHTTSFTQTADGTVWATVTERGLCELRDGRVVRLHKLERDLLSTASTTDGTVWVGTGDGQLLSFRKGRHPQFQELTVQSGMNGDMVEKIVVDNYNHLWIHTNQRLTEFDPRTGAFRVVGTTTSDHNDNVQLLPRFMPRAISFDSLHSSVVAGGFDGFIQLRPSLQIEGMPREVRVLITDVTMNGTSLPFDRHLPPDSPLPASARNIAIHFSSLDYLHASTIRYAYRFDGGEWMFLPAGQSSVQFNRLTKGDHTLELKATDANGLWSDQVTTFRLHQRPAWYNSTPAYCLYALVLAVIAWLTVRYLLRRTRRQESEKWSDSAELVAMRRYVDTTTTAAASTPEAQLDDMLIRKATDIVRAHLSNPDFSVLTLAEQMNMSRSTLTRKIKAIRRQTPLEFIRNIKMQTAREMLTQKTATVADVAQRVGYADANYFADTFRDWFGMLPSEFQQQQ